MGKFGSASASLRAARVAELAEEAKRMAVARDHFVSHLSSNLDSIASGAEQRPYGMSFARAPHERMSSPTSAEPSGRSGVVFARVGGEGLDYARPEHRRAVDAVLGEAIASTGTAEHGYAALRDAGVQWVNNWNGIGEAPELHALDATAIDVRKSLPLSNRYKFPAPEADHGIIVNGNWRAASTAGSGGREVRGSPPPPPPPPPRPAQQAVAQWRHPMSDEWDKRVHAFAKRSGALPPPEEGYTRLYRAGEIPSAAGPRSADDVIEGVFGGTMTRGELDALKGSGHSNPLAAEGRWFTDAADELDFYIRENDHAPVYYLDMPSEQAVQYRADNTPFKVNSRNHQREFVPPFEQVRQSQRLLDGLRSK